MPQLLVQASLDNTFSDGTEVTELLLARPAQEDFELTAGNGQIRGIATNGTHMWDLQKNFVPFDTDTWIRVYQMSDKTFDSQQELQRSRPDPRNPRASTYLKRLTATTLQ